jgi:hypothetical protein
MLIKYLDHLLAGGFLDMFWPRMEQVNSLFQKRETLTQIGGRLGF